MPPTSLVIQAYKRNDEWHKDASRPDFYNPDHHERTKKLIKKVEGQWWKITIDDKEDWQLAFLDYWESCESGKDRRSPEQVAADKAEAIKKTLPPSMQGNVVVPTRFKVYQTMKQARESEFTDIRDLLFLDQRSLIFNSNTVSLLMARGGATSNKAIHFIYLRFSGSGRNLDTAKLSGVNQLADFQKVSNQAFPVALSSSVQTSLASPEARPSLVKAVDQLSKWGSIVHFFVLGLEGFVGMKSAFQQIYDAIKQYSLDRANQATITYALQDKEADLYDDQAELIRISDTKQQRRCIRFNLHEILTATNNAKVNWLREQLKLRTDGRTSLEGAIDAKDFYRKRTAASLGLKRHAAYGNMKGNKEDANAQE